MVYHCQNHCDTLFQSKKIHQRKSDSTHKKIQMKRGNMRMLIRINHWDNFLVIANRKIGFCGKRQLFRFVLGCKSIWNLSMLMGIVCAWAFLFYCSPHRTCEQQICSSTYRIDRSIGGGNWCLIVAKLGIHNFVITGTACADSSTS